MRVQFVLRGPLAIENKIEFKLKALRWRLLRWRLTLSETLTTGKKNGKKGAKTIGVLLVGLDNACKNFSNTSVVCSKIAEWFLEHMCSYHRAQKRYMHDLK